MLRKIFYYAFVAGVLGIIAREFFFDDAVKGHFETHSWTMFLSMSVLIAGSFYALLERSIVVGVVTLLAALALPFVVNWIILYWPWVRGCCLSLGLR